MAFDKDRRPATRHSVFLFTGEVTKGGDWRVPTGESEPLGRTRDLSMSGAFVETIKRPVLGSIIEIVFMWGDEGARCDARVVRHDGDGIGVEFVEPSDAFLYALREMTGQ
ncbi:MAG: PilZ domain-containing protein [Myxococcota bacterium]